MKLSHKCNQASVQILVGFDLDFHGTVEKDSTVPSL